MLSLPPSVRLFVATQPVDGRKGPDSLMALVRDVFRHDPLSGHLFIFFSKRCDRVRVVYWDRNGYAMWTKRLEKGRFRPSFSVESSSTTSIERLPVPRSARQLRAGLARKRAFPGRTSRTPELTRQQ